MGRAKCFLTNSCLALAIRRVFVNFLPLLTRNVVEKRCVFADLYTWLFITHCKFVLNSLALLISWQNSWTHNDAMLLFLSLKAWALRPVWVLDNSALRLANRWRIPSKQHESNVGVMSADCLRRWPNIHQYWLISLFCGIGLFSPDYSFKTWGVSGDGSAVSEWSLWRLVRLESPTIQVLVVTKGNH